MPSQPHVSMLNPPMTHKNLTVDENRLLAIELEKENNSESKIVSLRKTTVNAPGLTFYIYTFIVVAKGNVYAFYSGINLKSVIS